MVGDAPVRVAEDDRPGWSRLVLASRMTIGGAREFHAVACDLLARGVNVAVRCEGVEHLDASAVQILLCLGREVVTRGHRFDIAGVSDPLAELFRLAGLANAPKA